MNKWDNISYLIRLNDFFNELNKLGYKDFNLENFFDGYESEELILKEVKSGIDIKSYLVDMELNDNKEDWEIILKLVNDFEL